MRVQGGMRKIMEEEATEEGEGEGLMVEESAVGEVGLEEAEELAGACMVIEERLQVVEEEETHIQVSRLG